jgi:IS30 family transposase
MAKNKHLTDSDRLQIQHGLLHRNSIKKIAFDLDKSPTTISREIRKRAVSSKQQMSSVQDS